MSTHDLERDPWAPREDGMSSIEIPEAPPGEAAYSRPNPELPCPPACVLGPDIRQRNSSEPLGAKPPNAGNVHEYVVRQRLDMTPAKPVEWLWPGRIPLGKFTLLVGDVGLGKSLLMLDVAARLSRGRGWPDAPLALNRNPPATAPSLSSPMQGESCGAAAGPLDAAAGNSASPAITATTPSSAAGAGRAGGLSPRTVRRGHTLILAAEDAVDDMIRPRLERLRADLSLIEVIRGAAGREEKIWKPHTWLRPLALPDDIGALEALIRERDAEPCRTVSFVVDGVTYGKDGFLDPELEAFPPVRLLILDPLASFFPRLSAGDNVQVRRMLQPLVDLAARFRLAIVGIHHLNKKVDQPGLYRPLGSQAMPAIARMVLGVARDPNDAARRVLSPIKSNVGPLPSQLAFRIIGGRVIWDPREELPDWDRAASGEGDEKACRWRQRRQAIVWLRDMLSEGEQRASDMLRLARQCLISISTLRRAREDLNVIIRRKKFDGRMQVVWSLPEAAAAQRGENSARIEHFEQKSLESNELQRNQISGP
ncbi:MAG: AAA family ATPase [Planctomycetaceae bacterium]